MLLRRHPHRSVNPGRRRPSRWRSRRCRKGRCRCWRRRFAHFQPVKLINHALELFGGHIAKLRRACGRRFGRGR